MSTPAARMKTPHHIPAPVEAVRPYVTPLYTVFEVDLANDAISREKITRLKIINTTLINVEIKNGHLNLQF